MDIKELKLKTKDNKKLNHPWEMARIEVVLDILKPFLKDKTNPKNVLDIGCGDVFFVSEFHKKYPNFKPSAVDIAFSDEIIDSLRDSIATYDYYVDFEKVHGNVKKIKIELNILNSLIGSNDIEND